MNLTKDAIYVWHVPVAAAAAQSDRLCGLLSPDEIARANHFATAILRNAFVLARASLRILIGKALRMRPDEIQFVYGLHGKPAIDGTGLQFNLSHSGEWAAVAIAWDCEVGVDIERIRPVPELEDIARVHFSPDEASELLSIPEEKRLEWFYRCWTKREARLKAIGVGLSGSEAPPGDSTETQSSSHAALSAIPRDEEPRLNDLFLESPKDYVTALAYSGSPRSVWQTQFRETAELLRL